MALEKRPLLGVGSTARVSELALLDTISMALITNLEGCEVYRLVCIQPGAGTFC